MLVGIIGGGAAGMMCAVTINELNPNVEVVLIEKNDTLGKKVIISGGGRCNVTTGIHDSKILLKKYPRGEKFLISIMNRFSPHDTYEWFENHGVPLKCENNWRVFTKSDKGSDIIAAFNKIFERHNTKVLFNQAVTSVNRKENGFEIQFKDMPSEIVDRVVLAAGGQAFRKTGSTGDGYAIAESLGHNITRLAPSLHSFITNEKWAKKMSGLSFENAVITVKAKKTYSEAGSFIFTHWGISGPAVFAISSLIAFEEFSANKPLNIYIDLFP